LGESSAIRSVLVRAPNWIGDQVLAYPFFHALREAYPGAHIASVCVDWVQDLQFRHLVDQVVVLPRPLRPEAGWRERLPQLEAAARELRGMRKWDLSISLPNSLSAAWLLFRSGAKIRRGYPGDGRKLLLTECVSPALASTSHRAQAYCELLPADARSERPAIDYWGIPPENDLDPGIPGVEPRFDAELAWPGTRWIVPPSEPYWVLAPGATAESRRWPAERFVDLADQICRSTGLKGLVVGGPREAPLAESICKAFIARHPGSSFHDGALGPGAASKLKDLTGQGSVPALWKVFSGARFTVTNESGLAHVASLCGSFVQVICGAADPKRTRPIGPGRVQVLVNPVDCWPCEKNYCSQPAETKLQCLKGIEPGAVWEEIQRGTKTRV